MAGTTINKLKKDKCYCSKKNKDIKISDCILFECGRWKKCMTKTNKDIDKDLIKRRDNNFKKIQKRQSKKEKKKKG